MSTRTLSRDAVPIAEVAHRIFTAADYDRLIELAGNAQFALIGEASHGTHEFYAARAELTRRLIEEKGFRILALEADWPDTLRVHRYITCRTAERIPPAPSGIFDGFPLGCGAMPSWSDSSNMLAAAIICFRKVPGEINIIYG